MRREIVLGIIPLFLLGCEGKQGPAGPEGPAGPPGTAGPVINTIAATPFIVAPGDSATITASVTHSAGTVLTVSWNASGGVLNPRGLSAHWTAPEEEGTYIVTLTVSDETYTSAGSVAVMVSSGGAGPEHVPGFYGRVTWPGHTLSSNAMIGVFDDDENVVWVQKLSSDGTYVSPVSQWEPPHPPGNYYLFAGDGRENTELDEGDGVGYYPSDAFSGGRVFLDAGEAKEINFELSEFSGGAGKMAKVLGDIRIIGYEVGSRRHRGEGRGTSSVGR